MSLEERAGPMGLPTGAEDPMLLFHGQRPIAVFPTGNLKAAGPGDLIRRLKETAGLTHHQRPGRPLKGVGLTARQLSVPTDHPLIEQDPSPPPKG